MIEIRDYVPADWPAVARIHDQARRHELQLAGLSAAFVPLKIAAINEGLFDYPGLFVAERAGQVLGFAACTDTELAWLYVDPAVMRQGVGRALATHALEAFPTIHSIEVLVGNAPAHHLYEQLGFTVQTVTHGRMPGNEAFAVSVEVFERG
ncbi:GNAT family N-acetyltransferase [Lacticaseibacillus absianus]|uniref:GNAT family N-acetyltransferase n=1 Tax=Lacticaseibacillus absianus TaxID=2729623 RepID=UPI0015C8EBFF|nr:GNAT family N-acetyltransferase [Lacticaseibacillus absianus]